MRLIKTFAFHLLLSFRGIILFISKLCALAFLGALILSTTLNEVSSIPDSTKIMMGVLGITFTSVYWFYDYLIIYFKPKMLDIMLLK